MDTSVKKTLIIGEVLVEIMANSKGEGFHETQALTGPYPSGAPAIFADQMAKLHQPVALVSCVGDDDFGQLNLARLKRDGVDISGIHIDDDRPTGSAFVRYRSDGSRDFVFNIRHSACGQINMSGHVGALIAECQHMHIMGSSLSSPELIALNIGAAKRIKAACGSISFDPNLRKEMVSAPGMRAAMEDILGLTDLFLPSGEELLLLTLGSDPITELFSRGIQAIVHKNGASGARYIDPARDISVAAYSATEIDPTGAGDCFGGAFIAFWLGGYAPQDCLNFACGAGALAVEKKGPMEGTSTWSEIEKFIAMNQG